MLVGGLPRESATTRALHGVAAEWSQTDHLLAEVIYRLDIMSWQLARNRRLPFPKRMARPGVDAGAVRHGSTTRPAGEIVAYLRRFAPVREEVTEHG